MIMLAFAAPVQSSCADAPWPIDVPTTHHCRPAAGDPGGRPIEAQLQRARDGVLTRRDVEW